MQAKQTSLANVVHRLSVGLCLCVVLTTSFSIGCNKEILQTASSSPAEKTPKMIGASAAPYGLEPMEVMGYGVIVGLPGSGGNVPQGSARSAALAMLSQQKMEKPTEFLASRDAAVVLVRGNVAPGARPGDTFDVEIRCLDEDKQTTSLRGGFLLLSSLKDVADVSQLSEKGVEGGANYKTGFEWAIANGPVMISVGQENDLRKGRVVGGARLKKERQLALMLRSQYAKKAEHAMRIGAAIDERFRVQMSGNFAKIANPKDDQHILLRVPDQYKNNVPRFLEVLNRIPYEAGSTELIAWQRRCSEDLLNPDKCFEAALRLEALGSEVKEMLAKGCKHESIKVRFACSEAMAYLGVGTTSADTLAEVAIKSPELRSYALSALAIVGDSACAVRLRELMSNDSIETRYGAFVALRTTYPTDIGLKSYQAREAGFTLYEVAPQSPPMVHISTTGKPEVVLFGKGQTILAPFSLVVGPELVVTSRDGEKDCTITMSDVGGKVVKRRCSNSVSEVVARCADMGASYADIVDLLRQASNGHNLSSKLVVDGMPRLIPWVDLARADISGQ